MTLDNIQKIAQTDSVPVPIAAEHYADGMERGKRVGKTEMLSDIINLMKSPEFHDYVWANWRNERELYDVMVKYLIDKNPATYRPVKTIPIKQQSSPQRDRLERSHVEADFG